MQIDQRKHWQSMEELLSKTYINKNQFQNQLKNMGNFFEDLKKEIFELQHQDTYTQQRIINLLVGPYNSLYFHLFNTDLENIQTTIHVQEFPSTLQSILKNSSSSIFTRKTIPLTAQEYFAIKIFQIIRDTLQSNHLKSFSNNLLKAFFDQLITTIPIVFFRVMNFYEHFFILSFQSDIVQTNVFNVTTTMYTKTLMQNQIEYLISLEGFMKTCSNRNLQDYSIMNEFNNSMTTFSTFITNFFQNMVVIPTLNLKQLIQIYYIYQDICLRCSFLYQLQIQNHLPEVFQLFLQTVLKLENDLSDPQLLHEFQNIVFEFMKSFPNFQKSDIYKEYQMIFEEIIKNRLIKQSEIHSNQHLRSFCNSLILDFEKIEKQAQNEKYQISNSSYQPQQKIQKLDWNSPFNQAEEIEWVFHVLYFISLFIDYIFQKKPYVPPPNSITIFKFGVLSQFPNQKLQDKPIPVTNLRIYCSKKRCYLIIAFLFAILFFRII